MTQIVTWASVCKTSANHAAGGWLTWVNSCFG